MIAAIFNRFKKTPSKALFSPGDRIAVFKRVGARNTQNNNYVSIESDMVLIFEKETEYNLIFRVRSNFKPSNVYEAKDRELIYFTKRNFKRLMYRKLR